MQSSIGTAKKSPAKRQSCAENLEASDRPASLRRRLDDGRARLGLPSQCSAAPSLAVEPIDWPTDRRELSKLYEYDDELRLVLCVVSSCLNLCLSVTLFLYVCVYIYVCVYLLFYSAANLGTNCLWG